MTSFRWLNIQQTCELNAPLCWCKQKQNILLQRRTLVEIGRWSEKWDSLLQSGRRDPLKYDPTCQRSRIIKMSPTTRASFHLRRKVEGKSWKVYDIYLKHLKIILKSLALVLVVCKSCLYQGYSEWRSSPVSDMACQIHPAIPLHTAVLYVVHYRIRPRAKTVRVPHLPLEDPLVGHRIHSSSPASRNARPPLIECRHRSKAMLVYNTLPITIPIPIIYTLCVLWSIWLFFQHQITKSANKFQFTCNYWTRIPLGTVANDGELKME